jgi:hypothetical protein
LVGTRKADVFSVGWMFSGAFRVMNTTSWVMTPMVQVTVPPSLTSTTSGLERERGRLDGSGRRDGAHAPSRYLDQRGIAERFLAEGKKAQIAASRLDISDFPTRRPYGCGLGDLTQPGLADVLTHVVRTAA